MCSVDGTLKVALVPHVYRPEMVPGMTTTYMHQEKGHEMVVQLDSNESPINLFNPDFEKFPTAYSIDHFYEQTVDAGDCLHIPAFYFYQVSGRAHPMYQKVA